MFTMIVRRLLQLPLILAVVLTLTFFMCLAIPGDPLKTDKMTPQVAAVRRAEFDLDEPQWVQFGAYLWHLCPLQFGEWYRPENDGSRPLEWKTYWINDWSFKKPSLRRSIIHGLETTEVVSRALTVSILLGTLALTLAMAAGTFAGIVGAVWRNAWPDYFCGGLSLVGVSLPSFVTGTAMLVFGSVILGWFPVGGWGTAAHLVLPSIALSLPYAAYISRLTRSGMLDVLTQDYVRTARAKGLPEAGVILKHAFRNAFLPVLSFLGPAAAGILTGSFVVEYIFTVPGIGRLFVSAVTDRDYFLILGTVLVYSTLLVLFNLVTDVLYGFFDPRIRVG